MWFAVATVEFFEARGFCPDKWRRSVDGKKAMAHYNHVKDLIPDIERRSEIQIYVSPSAEFDNLINGPEWYIDGEVDTGE